MDAAESIELMDIHVHTPPKRLRKNLNLSLCIVCQLQTEHDFFSITTGKRYVVRTSPMYSRPCTIWGIWISYNSEEQNSWYYCTSAHELESQATWHRKCYIATTHPGKIKRAKKTSWRSCSKKQHFGNITSKGIGQLEKLILNWTKVKKMCGPLGQCDHHHCRTILSLFLLPTFFSRGYTCHMYMQCMQRTRRRYRFVKQWNLKSKTEYSNVSDRHLCHRCQI